MPVASGPASPPAPRRVLCRLRALFALPEEDPALAALQLTALAQRVPALYAVVIFNVASLAVTYHGVAPAVLALVAPAVLAAIAVVRMAIWLRRRRCFAAGGDAIAKLRMTRVGVALFGGCAGIWALLLLPYGAAFQQGQVELSVALTLLTCVVCLIHLRSAALLLCVIVGLPFGMVFLRAPDETMRLGAASAILVLCIMVQMLLRNAADFVALSLSERELQRRQKETQRLSDENLRLANLDPLTGLPNRRRFFTELELVLAGAGQTGRRFAVALLDLDRFKSVNDIHGHAAGDRLLTQIGSRLRRLSGQDVFIARLGGDEFGIILTNCERDDIILSFGADVKRVLEAPCVVGDRLAVISCSAGVAIYPHAGATTDELFERADYALYHGKQTRKGGMVLFSGEHETRIRAAARIEQAFRIADLETELWVAFQPIVDVAMGKVVAFEALARWQSRELGPVGPGVFVPIAERSQMIGDMTRVLLQKALSAARFWPAHVSLCFNLSPQNFNSAETMAAIRAMVRSGVLAPSRIEFEVTESALLQDFEQAEASLQELRALGVRIALDDFGTGFSSLGYVNRLKLDKIKIDRSFVTDVHASLTSANIVKTIIALCQNLKLDCVVEGVETQAQLHAIAALGCRFIQGFLISKPVGAEVVSRLIEGIERTNFLAPQPKPASTDH